jgi:hypothetical protein
MVIAGEEKILINRRFIGGILLATGIVCAFPATAMNSNNSPLEVAIFPPLQYPATDFSVTGLRLSVVGVNREASGLDLALLGNVTNVMFKGLAISGLFNYNRAGATIIGLQVAGIANINPGHSEVYGLQLAGFNNAGTVHGLQLGLINIAHELHGIQIGLFNVNMNGPFHASPIINAAF